MKKEGLIFLNSLLVTFFVSALLFGCGGRGVIVPTKPIEMHPPEEFLNKFDVKEEASKGIEKTDGFGSDLDPKSGKKKRRSKKVMAKNIVKDEKNKSRDIAGPSQYKDKIQSRRPPVEPLWVGEKITMDVTWLNTKAGEFILEVQPFKYIDQRKVYSLKGVARTSELMSLIYRAEDWVQSFVDFEGWFPYKFVLHGDETKHIRDNLELFDHFNKKLFVNIVDRKIPSNEISEEKGVRDLTPFSQDSFSAIYFVRTLKLDDGKVINFPMSIKGQQWETEVTVLKREEIRTGLGYHKAVKTKVLTRYKGELQQKGDAYMWLTDDDRKIPLKFEAKVKIGWVAGIVRQIEYGTPPSEQAKPSSQSEDPSQNPNNIESFSMEDEIPTIATSGVKKANQQKSVEKHFKWFRHLLNTAEGSAE